MKTPEQIAREVAKECIVKQYDDYHIDPDKLRTLIASALREYGDAKVEEAAKVAQRVGVRQDQSAVSAAEAGRPGVASHREAGSEVAREIYEGIRALKQSPSAAEEEK